MKLTQAEIATDIEHLIPPALYETYAHLTYGDMAEVPELAGCMADGRTKDEALKAVEQVAAEWIETAKQAGREIPKPRGRLTYA